MESMVQSAILLHARLQAWKHNIAPFTAGLLLLTLLMLTCGAAVQNDVLWSKAQLTPSVLPGSRPHAPDGALVGSFARVQAPRYSRPPCLPSACFAGSVPDYLPKGAWDHVTLLASFPGSGNTWLRHLLQQGTRLLTGSDNCDRKLFKDGFPAEFDGCAQVKGNQNRNFGKSGPARFKEVVAVKTHYPYLGLRKFNADSPKISAVVYLLRSQFSSGSPPGVPAACSGALTPCCCLLARRSV